MKQLTITLEEKIINQLKRIAKYERNTTTGVIRKLLDIALEHYERFKKETKE